ncbi:MAG: hypothetical protein V3U67_03455 [Gemmatimonadota bacterium]
MRVAAIDIGTNSVRLTVAEPAGTRIVVVAEERIRTRLGSGLYADGRITNAALARTLAALEQVTKIAADLGADRSRAIGTSALREASNAGDLLEAALDRAGLEIDVISEREEAELAFRSVRHYFELGTRPVLVADIGGGSVELVHAAGSDIERVDSLPLGAVRLTETFLGSDPVTETEWQCLVGHIDALLGPALSVGTGRIPALIGNGGTYTVLAFMSAAGSGAAGGSGAGAEQDSAGPGSALGHPLQTAWVERQAEKLRTRTEAERREIPGLPAERADIIVAGAAVALRIAQISECPQTLVNDRGIRHGIVLELLEGGT